MRWSATTLAYLAAALLCGGGCRAFDEALLADHEDAGALDASADAGLDAAVDGATPACPLRRPPPRPAGEDGPGGETVVYALRDMVLDQRDGLWATLGYDLDGLCSVAPDPMVECLPPAPSAPAETDGEGGIDNVLGHQVLPFILLVEPDFEEDRRDEQTRGVGTLIVELRGWNGEDDDPRVHAVMSQSVFGTPALADGGAPDASVPDGGIVHGAEGNAPPLPRWDGSDWWWSRDEGFVDGDPTRPRVQDDNAYVSGGTFVMRIPDRVPIVFGGSTNAFAFLLTDATLTMEISADRQRIEHATLAGRWPVSDVLTWVEQGGVCQGSDNYDRLQRLADLAADVRAIPGTGGPGAVCDALSMAIGYSGLRAHWAGVGRAYGLPGPCADAGTDGGLDGGLDGGFDGSFDGALDGG